MRVDAIMIDERDNVATALKDLPSGGTVIVGIEKKTREMVLAETIAYGHKFAVKEIAKGESIFKYGEVIGRALERIPAGRHVHVHNVESLRGRGDLEGKG